MTSIGLHIRPSAKTSHHRWRNGQETAPADIATEAPSVSTKKRPLSTSLRSATHATDSTCSGWTAKTAATKALRQSVPVISQREKKEHRGRRVEHQVGQMMARRLQTEELAIQHMGDPGQRVPVAGVHMGKRPNDSIQFEAAGDRRVFEDVIAVVEINELVVNRLAKDEPGEAAEKDATARALQRFFADPPGFGARLFIGRQ